MALMHVYILAMMYSSYIYTTPPITFGGTKHVRHEGKQSLKDSPDHRGEHLETYIIAIGAQEPEMRHPEMEKNFKLQILVSEFKKSSSNPFR
jgi:hypothetical protein